MSEVKKQQTQKDYQEMLQIGSGRVDVGNNTLFAKNEKVKIDKSHLTLVISSGGSGASAIKEAIRTAEQKLEEDFSRYMKFILVDSAENEINGAKKQMVSSNLQTFNISVDGAQERMEYKNRPDFFRTWVHEQYDETQLGKHGSGRDRMTGKIKFYDKVEGSYIDVKFRNMIRDLYNKDWATSKHLAVDIMILAGVSGGNGSGTYLELAAHARKACIEAGATGDIRVFGYLFLPDVVEAFEEDNLDVQNQLYINGYAALKELESYMDLPFNQERKEVFSSRDGVTDIVVDANRPLFTYPVLISGDYYETKSMMAESIINLALENTGGFDQNSFYNNTKPTRDNYLNSTKRINAGLLTADSFPEDSHRYAGIGYAYASIPEKIITANIVSNVCRKMYAPDPMKPGDTTCFCTNEKRLPRSEMEEIVRRLFSLNPKNKVTERSFWEEKIKGKLDQVSTLSQNTRDISKDEIRSGKTEVYKQGFEPEPKKTDGKKTMEEHFGQIWSSFMGNATLIMEEYGPRVMEFVYSGKGPDDKDGNPQYFAEISVKKMLEYAKQQLQGIVEDGKRGVEPSNDIPSGFGEAVFKKKLNEWKTQFHYAVQYQVKQEIAKGLIEQGGSWEKYIAVPITTYVEECKNFAGRIETLADFYKSEGNALEDASYERFVKQSQQDNCVNLCTDANVFQWVKTKVAQKINSIPVVDAKTALIEDFAKNREAWVSMEEGVTRKAFDAVMARCCGLGIGAVGTNVLSLTATDYFNYVLDQVPPAQVAYTAQNIVEEIIDNLIQKSKPAIRKVPVENKVNRFMMLPKSIETSPYGSAIITAFKDAWGKEDIPLSPSVSDIVCYQTSVANGMCDLLDIGKWEKAYYDSNSVSIHLSNGEYGSPYIERKKTQIDQEKENKENRENRSNHVENLSAEEEIIFGTGLSWRHYPPLDLRNIDQNAEEQKFMNTIFNPIVDFALEQGIIERKEVASNTYQYILHVIPKNWENLDVSAYNEKNEEGEYITGERMFEYLCNLNPLGDQSYTKEILLSGSGYFERPFDFTRARNAGSGKTVAVIEDISLKYMKRILRRNTELFLELRDTLNRYYPIYQTMKEKVRGTETDIKINNFIRYFEYGLITEENNVWYLALNSSGTSRKPFCKFTDLDTLDYTPFERKLKADWKIILAIHKLKREDFRTLYTLLRELLKDMPQEELEQLKEKNIRKLLPVYDQIEEEFAKKWPNRELMGAIEKELAPSGDADYQYVNIIITLHDRLFETYIKADQNPDLQMDSKPITETETMVTSEPKKTWDCPNCGKKGNTTKFCPDCGNVQPPVDPIKIMPATWDCPNCGKKGNTTKFCPDCGNVQPPVDPIKIMPATWDCPNCERKGNTTKFCPNCGTKEPEKTWDCPECGMKGIATAFCPNCGNKR